MAINISDKISAYQIQYSQSTHRTMSAQGALKILSESGKKQDKLSISRTAQSFSKESIAALIDKSANVSMSELSYYFANYNNPGTILDAINFGENVSCGYNPDFKEYGVDNTGHIHVSPDDTFTSTEIVYPSRSQKI